MTFYIANTAPKRPQYPVKRHHLQTSISEDGNFLGAVTRVRGITHEMANVPSEDSCLFASGYDDRKMTNEEGAEFLGDLFELARDKTSVVGISPKAQASNETTPAADENTQPIPAKPARKPEGGAVLAAAVRTQEGLACRVAGDANVFVIGGNGKVYMLSTDQAVPLPEKFPNGIHDGPSNGIGPGFVNVYTTQSGGKNLPSDWQGVFSAKELASQYGITEPATILVATDGITDTMLDIYPGLLRHYEELYNILNEYNDGTLNILDNESRLDHLLKMMEPEAKTPPEEIAKAEGLIKEINDITGGITGEDWIAAKKEAQIRHVQRLVDSLQLQPNPVNPTDPNFAIALTERIRETGSKDDIGIVTMPLSGKEAAIAVACDGLGSGYHSSYVSQRAVNEIAKALIERAHGKNIPDEHVIQFDGFPDSSALAENRPSRATRNTRPAR